MTAPSRKRPARLSAPAADARADARYPRRAATRLRTRGRIIAAAQKLFADLGYQDATMTAIAAAADVHVATLFTHFPSKRDLMAALSDAAILWLEEAVAAQRGQQRFLDFWADLVRRAAASYARKGEASFALARDAIAHPDLLPAWLRYEERQAQLFAPWLADEMGLDAERDPRPMLVAAMVVAGGVLAYRRWFDSGGEQPIEAEAEALIAGIAALVEPHLPHGIEHTLDK
jgi:AcrR family transcriptional regulator